MIVIKYRQELLTIAPDNSIHIPLKDKCILLERPLIRAEWRVDI